MKPLALILTVWMATLPMQAHAQILPAFGRDRAGTVGFQFLKIPVDARSASLGQTVVAGEMDASALFWNPALAAQAVGLVAGISHTAYFADITMEYLGVMYPVGPVVLGVSVQALQSGSMAVTTEFEPFGTGEHFQFTDVAIGLSVAQRLTDLFSYGVTAKWVQEGVFGLNACTVLFDLGMFYRVGATGIQMAVAIRNFGVDGRLDGVLERLVLEGEGVVTETDFGRITPPTTFLLGVGYHLFQQENMHDVLLTGQITNPNDNAEHFNLGIEYTWRDLLILRTGYRFGVEEFQTPAFGLGLHIPVWNYQMRFDYGFTRLERLGVVHRITLHFRR